MDSDSIIITLLVLCGILTVAIVFSEPLKHLLKLLANSVFGAVALFAINTVFGFTGLGVGINMVTIITAGVLGLPGIAALYIVRIILG
ncbi:MAG: pro-sigmaK processing inhibitor BofA family protein [Firmicutes bacterium]|nr:pro-sigmaK processing inhibitor BofA family protein [Bacillota bacterium]